MDDYEPLNESGAQRQWLIDQLHTVYREAVDEHEMHPALVAIGIEKFAHHIQQDIFMETFAETEEE